jgi:hypothetical protein
MSCISFGIINQEIRDHNNVTINLTLWQLRTGVISSRSDLEDKVIGITIRRSAKLRKDHYQSLLNYWNGWRASIHTVNNVTRLA